MNIIIAGGGKVGETLIEQLSGENHDVVVIDTNSKLIERLVNSYDILGICGNAANYDVQIEASVDSADVFIALTQTDELNILSCLVAKKAGVKHTIARVRNPDYSKQFSFFKNELGLSMTINPEYAAAGEIAKVLHFPSAINMESFAKGAVDLAEIRLNHDNPLCDTALSEIQRKFNVNVLVCAVQRKSDVFIPNGDSVLKADDKLYITAPRKELVKFMKKLGIYRHKTKNIMIIGGGKVGYYLAKQLSENGGYNVKIIENNLSRCEFLSEALPDVRIINGDGTDRDTLFEQGIESLDAFVALTTIDEENIISSMYASSLGITKTVAKINRVSSKVLQSIGMDSAFSSKNIAADRIVGYIRAIGNSGESSVQTLYKLVDGKVEALEFFITSDFGKTGIPLKDLKTQNNTLIASIIRNGRVIFPRGDDTIQTGDSVIIVSKSKQFRSINEIFK